jgi:flagellin-specific chaperone FliS
MNNTIIEQLVAAINEHKGTEEAFQNVQDLYDYATEWEQAKGATLADCQEAWKQATKIKNQAEVDRLLSEGWEWDTDQKNNPGQINSPDDEETYYDAETDTMHKV